MKKSRIGCNNTAFHKLSDNTYFLTYYTNIQKSPNLEVTICDLKLF